MNDIDYWLVIRWILLVLAAGFIGQFGKSFAKHLIARVRARKGPTGPANAGPPAQPDKGSQPKPSGEEAAYDAKAAKKAWKAMAKLRKKEQK